MSRPLRLCGAIAIIASLWLPWYGIAIPDAVRQAVDAQAGQLPEGFADFARGILASLPKSIQLNGWQAFEGADVAIALIAGAAAIAFSAWPESTPTTAPQAFPPPPTEQWAPPAPASVPPPRA